METEEQTELLDGVDLGDERPEINPVHLPVVRRGVNDVQRFAETVFKPHRHHHPRREERGKKITLFHGLKVAVELFGQPRRVMALGETDRRRGLADQVVLFDQAAFSGKDMVAAKGMQEPLHG